MMSQDTQKYQAVLKQTIKILIVRLDLMWFIKFI